ncbi:MBL fold metallo-hydrolase [Glycomyces sp. L485]|uniref:MBL fold metallo-hydrolase n=1 Tax=Glycomyces sp. L485 TaxID=2909235 RepID=UPI001F4A542E|nr:MBL fold metallo-hydrolase [Glycomyces sp. L485]MCH7230177.1 MBL fold metallo-hydrolase [Glycomyces sp. L485]
MSEVGLTTLVDEGLGNASYLLDLGDGGALVLDPSRDLRSVRAAAERQGLRPRFVAETHLHADFVSGALQLRSHEPVEILASAAGDRTFAHRALADGDEVDLGGLTLRALGTPGHTDEHLSYLLLDGAKPLGVFTGGSLIVGAAARTDLVDPARTEELARAQYRSIQRLLELPDTVAVWPTHGAGSFCSAPPGAERTSTIGAEKIGNRLLEARSEGAFAARLISGLGTFPTYFDRLGEVNRAGPAVVDEPPALPPLRTDLVRRLLDAGAVVVDVRPVAVFGASHIPGAVSIPLREQFATWLGWIVESDSVVVIVRDQDQDLAEIAWQAVKIGYDLAGELDGGMASWDGPTTAIPVLDAAAAAKSGSSIVLDVRQDSEYATGHLPGAVGIELGALSSADLPPGPLLSMCGHGERAMTGASIAARRGSRVAVLADSPSALARATGTRLVEGR